MTGLLPRTKRLSGRSERLIMKLESDIRVFEDRKGRGERRVEYFDEDGGGYVTARR